MIHGLSDLSKKGDPAPSHPMAATVQSPCPAAASCGFAWEAKLDVGDSTVFGVRELGWNPGSASTLFFLGGWG